MKIKMNLTDPKTIKALLSAHSKVLQKSLGQNFLIDEKVLKTITTNAKIKPKDHIIEVGTGVGVLTQKLAEEAEKITTIEFDKNLLPILEKTLNQYKNIEIINQNALKFEPPKKNYKIVANIPYNITSPLIRHFLYRENKPKTITLLIQKEVAEKICELEPKMSILSLQVALFGKPQFIKIVLKNSFLPAPKVDSAIIHIEVFEKSHPEYTSLKEAEKILNLAKHAFTQKRKKLSNTLTQNLSKNKNSDFKEMPSPLEIKEKLISLSLSDKRPQTLSVQDWKKLIS